MVKAPPRTMYEVYMSLPESTPCQLINDTLVMSPAPLDTHQKILIGLASKILVHVEKNKSGEVRVSPYDVHLNKENIFQPDIVFISNANVHLIKENGLHGAPDLVIEILSKRTAKYDLGDKKDIYERYGVKEYWLIEPATKQVTFFKLVNNEFIQGETQKGVIDSKLLNVTITF